ncbi:antibiotic biosynthesis monooxygenase family protein [Flaviflexus huanghaiensis]|uniref:antibiotic biosynthesis monooxygenase family protein n=1 Tax=Flaviflexus huanghaiensis TaxID=1111473 RepID=UPI0015FB170B|nr:antibiotic biosynthesis monooxygenase family protein [Flaviflexus huanghaiensis]
MTVVKINAIDVPADSGDALAERFAPRADAMNDVPGFEGFELLRPEDDRTTWLVMTRWADEASFEKWRDSENFRTGHSRPEGQRPVGTSSEVWSYSTAVRSGR